MVDFSRLQGESNEILLQFWLDEGGLLEGVPSLKNYLSDGYYQATYQKFNALRLKAYDRYSIQFVKMF